MKDMQGLIAAAPGSRQMLFRLRGIFWRPSTLRERALNASLWNVLAMGIQFPLRLGSNLLMTSLLAPEAFGLMATVTALHTGLALLSDVGILQSVMRHPRADTPRYLRTAWVVQIIRGALITGLLGAVGLALYFLGPRLGGAGTVYADPRLPWLIWLTSLGMLIAGFKSTTEMLARRRMKLGRVVVVELLSQIVTIVTMVGLGLALRNVWALASGVLVGNLVLTVLTHVMLPGPRMRIAWDRAQTAEMWSFGKWLIGSSVGGFLVNNADRLIFAALVDKSLFGVYAVAALWVQIGAEVLSRVAGSVFLPAFRSAFSDGRRDVDRFVARAAWQFAAFTIAISVSLAIVSGLIIIHFYAATYRAAVEFILLLSAKNLLLAFSVIRQFLVFRGYTRYSAAANLAGAIAVSAAMYVVYQRLGFEWSVVVFALGSAPVAAMLLLQREVRRRLDIRKQFLFLAVIVAAYVVGAREVIVAWS